MNTPTSTRIHSDFLSDLIERSYDALASTALEKTPISTGLEILSNSTEPHPFSSTPSLAQSSARKLDHQLARLQTKYDELVIHSEQHYQQSQRTIRELTERCAALEKDRKYLMEQEMIIKANYENQISQLTTSLSSLQTEHTKMKKELDRHFDNWSSKEQSYLETIAHLKRTQQCQETMQISLIEKEKENELLRNDILMLKEKNQNLINDKCLPLKSTDNSDVPEKRVYVLRLNPLPQEQEIFPNTTNEKESEFKSTDNNNLSITDLQEQLSNSEKKLARLMEIFKQKIKQFREVVFTLLGYQIDMQSDGSIKLRSLYAFHEDDWIEFRRDDLTKGMKLMESSFLIQYSEELERFVRKGNSIPAFLSSVTNSLWDKSTMAI